MKKLTVLVLTVSILVFSVVPVYADFTTTDSSNLSAIKSSVTSGGALYALINSIKSAYGSTTSSGSILYYFAQLYNTLCTTNNNTTLRYYIQGINTALKHNNVSASEYLSRIWNKLPSYADMSLGIASTVRIDSTLSELYNVLIDGGIIPAQLLTDVHNIDTDTSNMSLYTYNMYSDLHDITTILYGARVSPSYPLYYTSWTDLSSGSLSRGNLFAWLIAAYSNFQTPLARLAYVYASDEEIQIRENASAAQTEFDTNFLDENGLGRIPDSSYGDIAGLSSQFTSAFTTGANPSAIFNVFDSANWGWFSQDTANSLDTTPRTRSSSNYPTPNLNAQIEAIYSLLGGE